MNWPSRRMIGLRRKLLQVDRQKIPKLEPLTIFPLSHSMRVSRAFYSLYLTAVSSVFISLHLHSSPPSSEKPARLSDTDVLFQRVKLLTSFKGVGLWGRWQGLLKARTQWGILTDDEKFSCDNNDGNDTIKNQDLRNPWKGSGVC